MQDTKTQRSLKEEFESATPFKQGNVKSSSLADEFKSATPLTISPIGARSLADEFNSAKPIIDKSMYSSANQEEEKEELPEDLKIKRLSEIDSEIAELRRDQEKIAENFRKTAVIVPDAPELTNINIAMAEKESRQAIERNTAQIKALRIEKNDIQKKLNPPTDQEKEEALLSFSIGSYANNTEFAFKDNDFLLKYGSRAYDIDIAAKEDRLKESAKIKLEDNTPETILSYDNIVHGEIKELKHATPKDVDIIWNTLQMKRDFHNARFDEKIKIIDKVVSTYVSKMEIATPEGGEAPDKKDIKDRILSNLLPRFMYSDEGGFSPEGTKLFLNSKLNEIDELTAYYEKAIIDAGFKDPASFGKVGTTERQDNPSLMRFDELSAKHGKENMLQWYKNVHGEYESLKRTRKEIERLLDYPEEKGGLRDIGKIFKTTDPKSLYTLMVSDMIKGGRVSNIVNKLEENKPITYAEKKELEIFATMNYLQSLGNEGTVFNVGKGIINMVPYIAQFALTKGAFTAASGATAKAMGPYGAKTLFKVAGKEISVQKLAGAALGSAAQTALLPQQYVTNALNYSRDNVSLMADPELGELVAKIDVGSGMNVGKAIARGLWDAYFEIFTERLGGYMKISPKLKGKLGSMSGQQILKSAALTGFMKTKGITSIKEAAKSIRKGVNWDGMMEEYLEEFVNYYMSGLADPANLKGPGN